MPKHEWKSGEVISATLLNDLEERASVIPVKGDTGAKGADGFGTKEQYDAIITRLDALEAKK
ncbi:hypothetical protein [Carnobacterium divergens]|uniref:hypothetical protein n=1 Tax=Carnobacterium divergens TaxID=2748 RepID=UPI0010733BFD|nr:hypothetical protein [Carnobacterium divergens]MDT1996857.1 hypothetical protein [Carnobacterium divergens]TFI86907.1 hypothetical protein CKN61_12740 [Carnobacterium divergens]